MKLRVGEETCWSGAPKGPGRDPQGKGGPFEVGDRVLHHPTGEEWILRGVSADGRWVIAAGWPETQALAADCTLVEAECPSKP